MDTRPTLHAALGNTWAHCVNTRLVLEEIQNTSPNVDVETYRRIKIAKSPVSPVILIPYKIASEGILLDEQFKVEEERYEIPTIIQNRTGPRSIYFKY